MNLNIVIMIVLLDNCRSINFKCSRNFHLLNNQPIIITMIDMFITTNPAKIYIFTDDIDTNNKILAHYKNLSMISVKSKSKIKIKNKYINFVVQGIFPHLSINLISDMIDYYRRYKSKFTFVAAKIDDYNQNNILTSCGIYIVDSTTATIDIPTDYIVEYKKLSEIDKSLFNDINYYIINSQDLYQIYSYYIKNFNLMIKC